MATVERLNNTLTETLQERSPGTRSVNLKSRGGHGAASNVARNTRSPKSLLDDMPTSFGYAY